MDGREHPKPRRPLPVPNTAPQRPNTPVMGTSSAVSASTFYGSLNKTPPPLPSRQKKMGSSHTTYMAPSTSSGYSTDAPPYREPELVTEDNDDQVPPLSSPDHWSRHVDSSVYNQWHSSGRDWNDDSYSWGTGQRFDETTITASNAKVDIDGRLDYEETNWWDPAVRERYNRPGPGILPPLLAEELHNPDHTLFSVSVKPPEVKLPDAPLPPTPESRSDPPSSPAPASSSRANHPPPSAEEVHEAVPHPNAYYCPKDNGWVILLWKSSSVAPPLAKSFRDSCHPPLPNQDRRKKTTTCLEEDQPFGPSNKTHHFHKYEKAADAHKLTPPFRQPSWEAHEKVKQKRRAGTIILDDVDVEKLKMQDDDVNDHSEGQLLDLKFFDEFVRDKKANPPPGKSCEVSLVMAFETLIMILENKLWKCENRMLRVQRPGFQNKLGWNPAVRRVFESLGFAEENLPGNETALRPPQTDTISPTGKENRARLLRAWVEVSAWAADYRRVYASALRDHKHITLAVRLDNARELYQDKLGAHPDQLPRGLLNDTLLHALQPLDIAWQKLGMTVTSYSSDLLAFAYLAQCRCDPASTVEYFTHFASIVKRMEEYNICPQQLQDLYILEQSRNRYTSEDVVSAARILGFGCDNSLKVEFDTDIPTNFIENAWRECVRRSWHEADGGKTLQREATEAFRILAESIGSPGLWKIWEMSKDRLMNPEKAYDTLEVPRDIEDAMLITIYSMRLVESPAQADRMRDALVVIAEIRDSERLRQFLNTGQDPGDIVPPTRPDLPRGLNQLGNTCYLNSLLQYFYTIKDLRDSVVQMGQMYSKSEEDKLTDDDLKRHRVGGRMVTRKEIQRSKKFIEQLANLFIDMETCQAAAVTPTIELAKLALVTSHDEEEEEVDKGGTDSSNDTDATLVEDGPSHFVSEPLPQSPSSPDHSPGPIFGKRSRLVERGMSEMDVDSPGETDESFLSAVSHRSSPSPQPDTESATTTKASEAQSATERDDDDIEMNGTPLPQKPTLPPRKAPEISNSTMMFGRQHDVAECMDNCMFQIETAMLKFGGLADSQDGDKTSVVKRLFYGKIRQRVAVPLDTRSTVHEKEDLFSHLPVNVNDDGVDIYDGLSGYFDDVVEYEGKKARMEVTLVELPPLLQIQLQRAQFNRETKQPYKSQAYVKFGETLFVDRFLDSADPQKKARSKSIQTELNSCRDRIRLLSQGKNGPSTAALNNSAEFLTNLRLASFPSIDDDLLSFLSDEQNTVNAEIDQLRDQAKKLKDELEAVWHDDTKAAYELTSVFIHRGSSPSWGHYFFYSRHLPSEPDSWFKYNDSDVTVVLKEEVLADTTGSTANPYLLVFARKGSEVVDTVKRYYSTPSQEEMQAEFTQQ